MNCIIKKIPTNILNSKDFQCKISQHKIIFLNCNKEFFNMDLPSYVNTHLIIKMVNWKFLYWILKK